MRLSQIQDLYAYAMSDEHEGAGFTFRLGLKSGVELNVAVFDPRDHDTLIGEVLPNRERIVIDLPDVSYAVCEF